LFEKKTYVLSQRHFFRLVASPQAFSAKNCAYFENNNFPPPARCRRRVFLQQRHFISHRHFFLARGVAAGVFLVAKKDVFDAKGISYRDIKNSLDSFHVFFLH